MPSKTCCGVADCKNQAGKTINGQVLSFHRFPRDPKLLNSWLVKCKRSEGPNILNAKVCSAHFLPSDFKRDLMNELLGLPLRNILKPSAVPSVFPGRNQKIIQPERGIRLERRNRKQMVSELLKKTDVDPGSSSLNDEFEGDYDFKEGGDFKGNEEFKVEDDSEGDEEEDEFEGEDEVEEDEHPSILPSRNQKVSQPKRRVTPERRNRKKVFKDSLNTNIDPALSDGELQDNSEFKGDDELEESVDVKVEEPEPWIKAQAELRFNCLICKSLATNEENYLKDPKNVDELTNLFNKLCFALKLKLPFQSQTWDFASEPFPFCGSCQEETLILCSLLDELESIEKKVSASVQKLSTLILTTESATMTEVGPSEWNFPDHRRKEELQEKYGSFRKAVFDRFNPKVNLLQWRQHPSPYAANESKPIPLAVMTHLTAAVNINPGILTAPHTFEKEDHSDTELDPLQEPETESCTEVETTRTVVPTSSEVEFRIPKSCRDKDPAVDAHSIAKQPQQFKYWVRPVDESTKTYHIEGFEFRELESGYECLTCKNIYPFEKPRVNRPEGKNKHRWGNVKIHIEKTHLRTLKGWCEICQKEYTNLSAHRRGVHGGESARRLCEVCGKGFKSYDHLAAHRYMTHHPHDKQNRPHQRNFQCTTCGKQFFSKTTLSIHSRSHTQARPYMCETCGKCFRSHGNWKTHLDGVHGERKFCCDQCGRKFGLKQGLQTHVMAIHQGIRIPSRKKKKKTPKDSDGDLDARNVVGAN